VRNALGSVQSVLVLGATSEIAGATVRALVDRGARRLLLAARDPARAVPLADELRARGADSVETIHLDALDTATHDAFAEEAFARLGDVDLALIAFGILGDERTAPADSSAVVCVLNTNFVGAASVMTPIARRMVEQGHGTIVVLSSVAGERVRRANFVYGSSKAGLDAFAQGLGDSLAPHGVDVIVVRPGFVVGRMTAGMDPAPLATTPDAVAQAIVRALSRRATVVWVPGILRVVMSALRHTPRALFRRLAR
jgi:decaprenylphospho-beta-D-erythro-pentofuranosid-2-ulose 2-reductase